MSEDPKQQNYFVRLAKPLLDAGLSLPTPVHKAIEGEFLPLSVDTRMVMPLWAKDRGYTEAQIEQLQKVIRALCNALSYRLAVAEDTSVRFDLAGNPVAPVSDQDRATAALVAQALFAKRREERAAAVAQTPVDALLPPAAPLPPPCVPPRSTVAPAPVAAAIAANAVRAKISLPQARSAESGRTSMLRTVDVVTRRK